MRIRLAFLALAPALVLVPALPAQETISKVKLAPQDFRGRQINLSGEVVEVRALSPRSERGVYRLVDGSDPAGILVRTDQLPNTGGPFHVVARLSPELLSEGSLLVDEAERDAARSPWIAFAGLVAMLGIAGAAGAFTMYARARRSERHMHLGPPMWLIPTGGAEKAEATAGPNVRFNYHLQYIQEERSDALDRRKRQLLGALAVAGGIGVAGSGWFLALRRDDASRPSFVLMAPEIAEATPAPVDPSHHPDDTLGPGIAPPPPPAAIRNQPELPEDRPTRGLSRVDSVRLGLLDRRRDSARARPPVLAARDTATVTPAPLPPPAPPPPPPVEEARDTVPTRAAPPPVDLEALQRAATSDLNAGILQFSRAVTAREASVVAAMFSPADARRRDRFVQFLGDASPTASFGATEPAEVTETAGDAAFTLVLKWRGDFGVERRKAVRFQASTRRRGDNWAFAGVRLLENFP